MTFEEQSQACDECAAAAALYALGALPPGETRQFKQRLASGCPLCTAELRAAIEAGCILGASIPELEPPAHLREQILNRIGADTKATEPSARKVVRQEDSPWLSSPAPGVEMRRLLGDKTLLVRMQPGSTLPGHEHRHDEQCYVLEGSVMDSDGATVYAGDFVCMRAGSTHQPIRTETGCVFLITYT